MTAHTNFTKGKRVIVVLTNGERFVDKFVERVGKGVELQQHGFIAGRKLRAITIYRGQS